MTEWAAAGGTTTPSTLALLMLLRGARDMGYQPAAVTSAPACGSPFASDNLALVLRGGETA